MQFFRRLMFACLTLLFVVGNAWAGSEANMETGTEDAITSKMMLLVLQVGIILFIARLGGRLAERAKMPGVLGELLAGIVIGPHALGALPIGSVFPQGMFPLSSPTFPISAELYGFCSVAAIILLFLAGAETDLKLFLRYSVAGSLVGIGGVLFSYLFGAWLAMWLLPIIVGGAYSEGVGFMHPAAVFLGVMSTATSVGITARILSEKRKMDSPEGVTILAGAVIDDVLGIIVLAIGMGVLATGGGSGEGGINWGHIGTIAGKAFGIWIGATVVGVLAARRISALLKWFRDPTSISVMALGLALIMGGFFEEMGLAMIIGAYVMGLALGRTDLRHVIHEHLHPIYTFMVPIFFTVMGMMVDLRQLASWPVLIFGGIYTVVAIAAKVFGCAAAAYVSRFSLIGALRVGAGMVPRGEVALIVAGIGLSAGFLTSDIFGVGILMTLVTTLAAPPMLVALFRHPGSGMRATAAGVEESHPLIFTMPSEAIASLMCERLLVAFRSDGFFTHTLNHEEGIYQIRREAVVIGLRQHGAELQFECDSTEETFVATAMLEVVADLERMARELKKPMDRGIIERRIADAAEPSQSLRDITDTLRAEKLIPRLKAGTKEEAIEELLHVLDVSGDITDIEAARDAVWERERSLSTGLEDGLAIPHGRTDAVKSLACAIGLSPEGMDFESSDGEPTRIIALTLSPRSQPAPHVQFIARLSQALNEEGRALLLVCRTAEEMASLLNRDARNPETGLIMELRRRLS